MGAIKVTVQTEKRVKAITDLSIAIKHVAMALSEGTHVELNNNIFNGGNPAVNIDTAEDITETTIKET